MTRLSVSGTPTVTGGEIKSFVTTDQIGGKDEMTKDGEILTLTAGHLPGCQQVGNKS